MSEPVLLGENAPDWLVLTSPRYSSLGYSSTQVADPDPVTIAEREAKKAQQKEERIAHKEAARLERIRLRAEKKAEEKRLRAEISERRRALHKVIIAARRKALKKPEERATGEKVAIAQSKARRRAPRLSPNRIPLAGMTVAKEAAATVGCSPSTVSIAIKRNFITCVRQGKYTYVRTEELRAYYKRSVERQKEKARDSLARLREGKAKEKPWPKLVKRGRKSA
jgi:hypothetical protein